MKSFLIIGMGKFGHYLCRELDVRVNYNINILGLRREDQGIVMPQADYRFEKDDHMLVMGSDQDLARFLKKLS